MARLYEAVEKKDRGPEPSKHLPIGQQPTDPALGDALSPRLSLSLAPGLGPEPRMPAAPLATSTRIPETTSSLLPPDYPPPALCVRATKDVSVEKLRARRAPPPPALPRPMAGGALGLRFLRATSTRFPLSEHATGAPGPSQKNQSAFKPPAQRGHQNLESFGPNQPPIVSFPSNSEASSARHPEGPG